MYTFANSDNISNIFGNPINISYFFSYSFPLNRCFSVYNSDSNANNNCIEVKNSFNNKI